MAKFSKRLAVLREAIKSQLCDGFFLQTGDEHISEYTADYAKRLGWLTGFRGSSAHAALLIDKAAIFVPPLYAEAIRSQVDPADWAYEDLLANGIGPWLAAHAAPGSRIGFDPWLHTRGAIESIERAISGKDIELVTLPTNPIDALWPDQPWRPDAPMLVQLETLTGQTSYAKRQTIADWLVSIDADACVLVALDSIAWLLNVRGRDIATAPLVYAYALVGKDAVVDLFVDRAKLNEEVVRHLGRGVRLRPYADFAQSLGAYGGSTVSIDPARSPYAIGMAIRAAGGIVRDDRDPTILAKAIKTDAEIDGMKATHLRDGVALTKFLHWFSIEAPKGQLTELSAAQKVDQLRSEGDNYHGLSFITISAFGPHAALPHYRPTGETDSPIGEGIYLLDSGGQYRDGTTDITRTLVVGQPTPEMKDRFTRVLKGHIALSMTVFPRGTRGFTLDGFARQYLWQAGIDYAHSTGHGVGSFLCVHEGPQSLGSTFRADEPFVAGMVISNEPGYYKAGQYGIRIENLFVVVDHEVKDAEHPMLAFDVLSYAPIERRLVDIALLTESEINWLDRYHSLVREKLGALLPDDCRAWLEVQTAPIRT